MAPSAGMRPQEEPHVLSSPKLGEQPGRSLPFTAKRIIGEQPRTAVASKCSADF